MEELVGRETELKSLISALNGAGAVLAGPAGIGKTRLAMEAADGSGRQTWWMAVTGDSASIPYGSFHPLVPELGEALDRLGTAGVTRGCNPPTNNRFCPNEDVTREQMAAFLRRALGG